MISKTQEKEKAIALRRGGLSYREIREQVSVSKSSLSLWLRSVGLSKKQEQRLTAKKLAAIERGWQKVKEMRILRVKEAEREGAREAIQHIKNPLWLIGTALYWAEGTKVKPWSRAQRVTLTNMDSGVIRLFIKWLQYLKVPSNQLIYSVYIHKSHEDRAKKIQSYWADLLNVSRNEISVYFKKSNLNPKRKNIGEMYFGVFRIDVRKSSVLNHKIKVWIEELSKRY